MKINYYIGLGSNLGDRYQNLNKAIDILETKYEMKSISSFYDTKPFGILDQPTFLNAAVSLMSDLKPKDMLKSLLQIEIDMGRVRTVKNGPRIIDLDILLADDLIITQKGLDIPHPGVHQRDSVLSPLVEIAPDLIHPCLNKSIEQLRRDL